MMPIHGRTVPSFVGDLAVLVTAVVIGGIAGALVHHLALQWTSVATARDVALATATTITGATHLHLSHRQPLGMVTQGAAVSAPVVYLAMRLVHLLVGP